MSPDTVQQSKQKLADILAGNEYRHGEAQTQGESLLGKLFDRFIRWFKHLFPHVELSGDAEKVIYVVIVCILFALFLALLAFLFRQLAFRRFFPGVIRLTQAEKGKSSGDYLRLARLALAAEETREAVRYAFLGMLFYLAEQRWIRMESWKTNLEYTDELKDKEPEWQELFRSASGTFERIWYGKDGVDADSARQYMLRIELRIREGDGHAAKT